MSTLPSFLRGKGSPAVAGPVEHIGEPYRPLLSQWLIRLALELGWTRKPGRGRWPEIFSDKDFLAVTGIRAPRAAQICDDFDDAPTCAVPDHRELKSMLQRRLTQVLKEPLSGDLPLFVNLECFARRLDFSDAETAVLAFAVILESFPRFRAAVSARCVNLGSMQLARLIARLCVQDESRVRCALREDGPLAATGILRIETASCDLEDKLDVMGGLGEILLTPHATDEDLTGRFLRPAPAATLDVGAFAHLAADIDLLRQYLSASARARESGVNILFHGPPGTGKTELVRALATALGFSLYEVGFADAHGRSMLGEARLRAYKLNQTLLARKANALLVFDEVEDVFPGASRWARLFGMPASHDPASGKAWMNRVLETNATPAIWVMNEADLDPAYLRRFDYSVRFSVPPHAVRVRMAHRHLRTLAPPQAWLAQVAANDQVSPAQYERAAKVARLAGGGDRAQALDMAKRTLQRSASLLGQHRAAGAVTHPLGFDPALLNTDTDVPAILAGVKRRPRGSFCFYGPSGTGKSALACHLAEQLGQTRLVKRASDLLAPWVGETERHIAEMFQGACEQEAVLILDEADSFLGERRAARARWEITQVNELLTQMEAFPGVFICTTNLMDQLDAASLRRFTFKLRFDCLTPAQRWTLFQREVSRLGGEAPAAADWEERLHRLEGLTPGDFAVAARQFKLWAVAGSAEALYRQLEKECETKGGSHRAIGFHACLSGVRH